MPIFISKDKKLPKIGKIFQQGYSHMAIVCEDIQNVEVMQKFCLKLHKKLRGFDAESEL